MHYVTNVHLTCTACRLLGITHGSTTISRTHLCASIFSSNHRFDTLLILYARKIYLKAIFFIQHVFNKIFEKRNINNQDRKVPYIHELSDIYWCAPLYDIRLRCISIKPSLVKMNNVIIYIFTIVALASKIDSSFMDKRDFDSNNTTDHNIDRLNRKECAR